MYILYKCNYLMYNLLLLVCTCTCLTLKIYFSLLLKRYSFTFSKVIFLTWYFYLYSSVSYGYFLQH